MDADLPRSSGIYQIRCIPADKIYIGSAVDLRARWSHHLRGLRKGRHHNPHLQAAWEKYGEASFEVAVLQLVPSSDLLRVEQDWIDRTGCTDRSKGFNIFETAGSPGSAFARTWEGFIDPGGSEKVITNLFEFCRLNDLDWPSMHRLAMGRSKLKSYKGWTHRNSVRQRAYVKTYDGFVCPDGQPAGPISNLAAFCRMNGLEKSHMVAVAHGRLFSHRGWTYNNGRRYGGHRTYTGFINADGQRVVITNLQAFCREHGLSSIHMRNLISGERRSHKGWTWKEEYE